MATVKNKKLYIAYIAANFSPNSMFTLNIISVSFLTKRCGGGGVVT